jgi:HAD superfamily hydrolase (TIGR01509 family)
MAAQIFDRRRDALLIDLDGTLIDTESLYAEAFFQALNEFGQQMTLDRYTMLVGHAAPARREMLAGWYGTRFATDAFLARYRVIREHRVAMRGANLRPGAEALLTMLEADRVPFGIVTSASRTTARRRLAQTGIDHRVAIVVTRDDVAFAKPHPHILLHAADLLGAAPEHCLVVEDSLVGAAAAAAAGMRLVLVGTSLKHGAGVLTACTLFELVALLRAQTDNHFRMPYAEKIGCVAPDSAVPPHHPPVC